MRVYYRFGWNSKRKICTWKHQRFCLIEQQAHAHAHLKLHRWKHIIETNSLKYIATHTYTRTFIHVRCPAPSISATSYMKLITHYIFSRLYIRPKWVTCIHFYHFYCNYSIVWWAFCDRLTVFSTTMICPQNVNEIILN